MEIGEWNQVGGFQWGFNIDPNGNMTKKALNIIK